MRNLSQSLFNKLEEGEKNVYAQHELGVEEVVGNETKNVDFQVNFRFQKVTIRP